LAERNEISIDILIGPIFNAYLFYIYIHPISVTKIVRVDTIEHGIYGEIEYNQAAGIHFPLVPRYHENRLLYSIDEYNQIEAQEQDFNPEGHG
jgi:hypothetical protein